MFDSFIKDFFKNIINTISENKYNQLKYDEYSKRQLNEYILVKNSKCCYAFTIIGLILGILFFVLYIAGVSAAQGGFLKIVGSITLFLSSLVFFALYKTELKGHNSDFNKLKIYFLLFWNLFTISGFFITAGFYSCGEGVYPYLLFLSLITAVPVFRIYESIVAAVIYLIPIIYYGVNEGYGFGFYIILAIVLFVMIWIMSIRFEFTVGKWLDRRKIKNATERCQSISQTDNLTGMLNRTGLTAKLKERYGDGSNGHRIAVIMADIDNFRFYNHKYGFDKSDSCLYNICNCIRITSKPVTDIVSRFGGDDFILVVEDMEELELVRFAEQLRSTVEMMAVPFGENGIVTISVGISELSELKDDNTYSKLLNEADSQLIIAKNSGKNCIGYRNRAFIQEKRKG